MKSLKTTPRFHEQSHSIGTALSDYLVNLGSFQHRLTTEQEADLAGPARGGDPEAIDQLFRAHMAQVVWIARRYHSLNKWAPIEDLVQAGNIGLLRAIDRFDPSIAKLSTYCQRGIIFAVQKELKRLNRCRTMEFHPDTNPHRTGSDDQDQCAELTMGNLPDDIPEPFEIVGNAEDQANQASLVARIVAFLKQADERLAIVLLGRCEGKTLEVLGTQLGISKERARQLENNAINLVRAEFATEGALPPVGKIKGTKNTRAARYVEQQAEIERQIAEQLAKFQQPHRRDSTVCRKRRKCKTS